MKREMPYRVSLKEVVDALDMQSEEIHPYLNKLTSEIVSFTDEMLSAAEEGKYPDDLPDWEKEGVVEARKLSESPENFIALPDKFDINEWSIMERFCGSIEDETLRDELDYLTHGTGAFRLFKDSINRHGIADDWYKFRDAALEQIAVEWLEANDIPYTREET